MQCIRKISLRCFEQRIIWSNRISLSYFPFLISLSDTILWFNVWRVNVCLDYEHVLHRKSKQVTHCETASSFLSFKVQKEQNICWELVENSPASIIFWISKFVLTCSPLRRKFVLHIGHAQEPSEVHFSMKLLRHDLQNVCKHGNVWGSVYSLKQIEQVKHSLMASGRLVISFISWKRIKTVQFHFGGIYNWQIDE